VAAGLALGALAGLTACGADGETSSPTTVAAGSSTTEAATTSTDDDPSTTGAPATTGATDGDATTSGLGTLAEGSHTGYLRGITDGMVEGQQVSIVSFDDVDFLTGQEAVDAAIAAGDAEPGATSIDNDYYLVNDDETPISLPVIPDSQVWVLVEGSPETVPAGIEDAVAQPGIYRIEVVVVRGVSLITGVEGVFVP
jgi:hypothetical protein